MMNKLGYWATHKYTRLSVEDLEGFVGWKPLLHLMDHVNKKRDKAFIATAFLTGGRVNEVLPLEKQNFEIRKEEGLIVVRGMPLEKRYKKIKEYNDEQGKKRWVTELLEKSRKPFPIIIAEPLVPYMIPWLEHLKDASLLFESPVKPGQPLTRFWAYTYLRRLEKKLPSALLKELDFLDRRGRRKAHFFTHWFRAQRASQLVFDYGFQVLDLLDWFGWEKHQTAVHYARKGWRGLASKMTIHKYV